MEPHPVTITSLNGARDLLTSDRAQQLHAVVSIGHQVDGQGEEFPLGYREFGSGGRQVKHRMNISDIRFLHDGWEKWSPHRHTPRPEDMQALIEFFPKIDGPVLFHCYAGMSRSPAAALAYLAWALGPDKEAEAVARLYEAKRHVTPNYLMIALADVLLRRGRRLYEAMSHRGDWEQYPELALVYEQAKGLVRGGDIPPIVSPGV